VHWLTSRWRLIAKVLVEFGTPGNDAEQFWALAGVCRHEADFELAFQIGGPKN